MANCLSDLVGTGVGVGSVLENDVGRCVREKLAYVAASRYRCQYRFRGAGAGNYQGCQMHAPDW